MNDISLAGPLRRRNAGALPWPSPAVATGLFLLIAAVALRAVQFGSPAINTDEEFYLLVGDRMLHGALPFVDIWDRKPIGLFLLYAAIRLLGGAGLLQYQLVATCFAAATAWRIACLAEPAAGLTGSRLAGLLYLVWIGFVGGSGGQAPVFYNLPVVFAAELVMRARSCSGDRRYAWLGVTAMALIGLAIQIKYTVLCEGLFFGLLLLDAAWRRWGAARGIVFAGLLAMVALLPSLLALGIYVGLGHGRAFWFANIVSILKRGPTEPGLLTQRAAALAMMLLPLVAGQLFALANVWRAPAARRHRAWFMIGWSLSAAIGAFGIGALFLHYTLPLLVPLVLGAAPLLAGRIGWLWFALLALTPLSQLPAMPGQDRTARAQTHALVSALPARVEQDCLLLLDGPPIAYLLSRACLASPYAFPNHLLSPTERGAIGADPREIATAALARRPAAVVIPADAPIDEAPAVRAIRPTLARAYRRTHVLPFEERRLAIYVRKDLPA